MKSVPRVGVLALCSAALLAGIVNCRTVANTAGGPSRPVAGEPVASWERLVDGFYENRGLAQIERLGDRWTLTVMCDGVHSTFVDDTLLPLGQYATGYVSARYGYVERVDRNAKCVQGPCGPVIERRIALERLTRVSATQEQAEKSARNCT